MIAAKFVIWFSLAVAGILFAFGHTRAQRVRFSKITPAALLYFLISIVLIVIWNGRFIVSPQIGGFDWRKDMYFLHFLRGSLVDFGEFPLSFYFVPFDIGWYPTPFVTSSYWANPEVLSFSPFLVLMPFLDTVEFIKIYFFLHFLIGAFGIFIVSKRLRLGICEALIMLILIILNPWLMQHVAIGYTPWIQLCVLPMIAGILVGSRIGVKGVVAASCFNALIIYGGGLHIFVWFNAAVALCYMAFALRRGTFNVLLNAFYFFLLTGIAVLPKVFAALTAFKGFARSIDDSYGSLADLWGLLTDADAPLYDLPHSYNIHGANLFDGAIFMGPWFIALLAFGLVFSVYGFVRFKRQSGQYPRYPSFEFVIVALIFIFLGWEGVWKKVVEVFPLLSTEICPYRFGFVAIILLVTFVVCEIGAFAKTIFTPRVGKLVIVLLFLPTVLALYSRNQLFVNIATMSPDPFPNYSLHSEFKKQIKTSGNMESTPNRIMIYPSKDGKVAVPWLNKLHLLDFEIKNGEPDDLASDQSMRLRFIDRAQPIIIRPFDFFITPLIFLAFILYASIVGLLWRYQTKQKIVSQPVPAADPSVKDGDAPAVNN